LATRVGSRPSAETIARFRQDLDALIEPQARLGLAISGGPDSLALLALAAACRPGIIEVATVDHALREESAAEADMVAAVAGDLGVPHATLRIEWPTKPESGIQERARAERYRLLAAWAQKGALQALVTAHHLDDQVETFVMRLQRGAGVRGLAGMRPKSTAPGSNMPLLRPLLKWRRIDLEQVCSTCGLIPANDPSNADPQFERVRIRQALADANWIDPQSIADSARHLADADEALRWATTNAWRDRVTERGGGLIFVPDDVPGEICRRIVRRAVDTLASEGGGQDLRGRELDRLLAMLAAGKTATIRGVLCAGLGLEWSFSRAPPRKGRAL
jgi:tRNA(Ile)-lysidine synthase